MGTTARLAFALALGWAGPAIALDLSAGTLRGSDEASAAVEATVDPWRAMATLDASVLGAPDPNDQLDAMLLEETSAADGENGSIEAPTTVQEAMMALAPPEPVVEKIPVLHAMPPAESVSYHVPRSSTSLSVLGGSWRLNNPRGSTATLGADWAR